MSDSTGHLLVEIIFAALLLTALGATILAIFRRPAWYWVAGIAAYFWSGMSVIGMLLVSISFVLLALAIGHSAGWIHSAKQSLVAIAASLVIWLVVLLTVDDYWVFWPVFQAVPNAP